MKTIKTPEECLINTGLTTSDSFVRFFMPDCIKAIHAYHAQFTTIYAIVDLDAEDLGSAIIATYYDRNDADANFELLKSGEHPELFGAAVMDVFEIKLPIPPTKD